MKGRANIDFRKYKEGFPNISSQHFYYGDKQLINTKTDFTVVFPMYENIDLVRILLTSLMECQKRNSEKLEIVIVDNFSSKSSKESLRNFLKSIEEKYEFKFLITCLVMNSSEEISIKSGYADSIMNAFGLHSGLSSIQSNPEFVFVAHSDVMFTSERWFQFLKSKNQKNGSRLLGFRNYNRLKDYAHVCGYMFESRYFNSEKIDFFPVYDDNDNIKLDVGDKLSDVCRKNEWSIFIAKNTFNKNVNEDKLSYPYSEYSFDRAVDDNGEVLFMHLGRGARKSLYDIQSNDKKKSFLAWKEIFETIFEGEKL